MSQTASTSTASSRFQVIFNDALILYQKQTKKDLTTHPLVSQLQPCDSTTAIIAVLQGQIREFNEACGDDERLTKWLNPTVNVLCAFSAAVSGGVSLVSLNTLGLEASSEIHSQGLFACECDLCRHRCIPYRKHPSISFFGRLRLTLKVL